MYVCRLILNLGELAKYDKQDICLTLTIKKEPVKMSKCFLWTCNDGQGKMVQMIVCKENSPTQYEQFENETHKLERDTAYFFENVRVKKLWEKWAKPEHIAYKLFFNENSQFKKR